MVTGKQVTISFDDIVEDFKSLGDSDIYTRLGEREKKIQLRDYNEQMKGRSEEIFSLLFNCIQNTAYTTDTEYIAADDAKEVLRKIWRTLRFVNPFTNFPKEVELKEENGEVVKNKKTGEIIYIPESLINISNIIVNQEKFKFIVDQGTVQTCISMIKKGIEDSKNPNTKYRFPATGAEMFTGTWYRRHLRSLQEAKDIDLKQA